MSRYFCLSTEVLKWHKTLSFKDFQSRCPCWNRSSRFGERRVRGGGVLMSVMKGVTEKLSMEFQNLLIEVSFQNRDFLLIKELSQ